MALAKHDFIDDYPYLVYTDVQTCVYSDKTDTSIDDIGGGGGSSSAKVYFQNPGESPTYPEVEVDGVETGLVDDVLEMGGEQMPCKSVTAVIGSIIGFSLVGMEIMACATATSDTSMDIPYTADSGSGTIVLPHESAFVAFTVS